MTVTKSRARAVLACLLLALSASPAVAADAPADAGRQIDAMLRAVFPPDQPGAAVIVVREGTTLLREGYGMADLELGVPIEPDMVFRIGSVTKQFTAAAVLMLAEEGKLALSDPITRFLPDFPTRGQTITLEHLLTHTSGVKSYTDLPEWLQLWRKDMTLDELIALFRDQPADFAPGERWAYSNSGYVLLGAVIEKASGMSYEEFLKRRVFAPAGMTRSRYGSADDVIARRVPGYRPAGPGRWANAPYLSMTQPFSAGALLSTIDDLARWDAALSAGTLLKPASLARAFTPARLKDGSSTGYGFGWTMASVQGIPTQEHGGGIHGFVSYTLRMPSERVYVAMLSNAPGLPPGLGTLAPKVAALAAGRPYIEPKPVALTPAQLDRIAGVYRIDEHQTRTITHEGGRIWSQRTGGERIEVFAASESELFVKDSFDRIVFAFDEAGRAFTLALHARYGPPEVARRTDEPLPAKRKAIDVDPALLDRYTGRYEIAPGFLLVVTREGDALMTEPTGQEKLRAWPESRTRFFLEEVDVVFEFVEEGGKVVRAVIHQGGRQVPARRLD